MLDEIPRRIACADAFGSRLILLGFPLAVLGQLVYWDPGASVGRFLAVSLIGYVVFAAVITCTRLVTVRLDLPSISTALVAIVGGAAGLARAGTSIVLWQEVGSGQPTSTQVAARLVSATLLGACLVPLGGLLIERLRAFQRERESLRATLVETEYTEVMANARGEALRAVVNAEIATEVDRAISTVLIELPDGTPREQSAVAALRMRVAASEVARLDGGVESAYLGIRSRNSAWIGPWWAAMGMNPLPIGLIVPLWISTAFPAQLALGEAWMAVLVTFIGVASIVTVFALARRLLRSRSFPWLAVLFGAVVAASIAANVLWAAVDPAQDWQRFSVNAAVGAIWLGFLTLLMSGIQAALYRSDAIVRELEQSINVAQTRAEASLAVEAELRKQAAALLHSDVQGRLDGAAAYLERFEGSLPESWVVDQLGTLPKGLPDVTSLSLAQLLEELASRWHGIVTVTWEVVGEPPQPIVRMRLTSIVNEALANAFRHGQAGSAHIDICESEDAWRIVVINDGRPPSSSPRRGLGQTLLDEASGGEWTLTCSSDGTGAILTARIRTDTPSRSA